MFLVSKQDRFLVDVNEHKQPMLFTYLSDGWGVTMMKCNSVQLPDGLNTKRFGDLRAEWLLEMCLFKAINSGGDISSHMSFQPPRAMVGKIGWHVFGASMATSMVTKPAGQNIIISLFVKDGLHLAVLIRRQQAIHDLYYDMKPNGLDSDDNYCLRCKD